MVLSSSGATADGQPAALLFDLRKTLRSLAPMAAVEVDWKYVGTSEVCTWRGKIFEGTGRGELRRWPVQYSFLDSADGMETHVESSLPEAPNYKGFPVTVMAIRPIPEVGPLSRVVLPTPPESSIELRWAIDGESERERLVPPQNLFSTRLLWSVCNPRAPPHRESLNVVCSRRQRSGAWPAASSTRRIGWRSRCRGRKATAWR